MIPLAGAKLLLLIPHKNQASRRIGDLLIMLRSVHRENGYKGSNAYLLLCMPLVRDQELLRATEYRVK
jgi:hypothetical protein